MSRELHSLSDKALGTLVELSARSGYAREAYWLVMQGLLADSQAESHRPARHHLPAGELCWRVHDLALELYAGEARQLLASWGVRSTADIGRMVEQLVEARVIVPDEEDRPEHFLDVFDFADVFRTPYFGRERAQRPQWSLISMLVILSLTAVPVAGYASAGMKGAVHLVVASWLALIGAICLYVGFADRSPLAALPVATVGLFLCAAGIRAILAILM